MSEEQQTRRATQEAIGRHLESLYTPVISEPLPAQWQELLARLDRAGTLTAPPD